VQKLEIPMRLSTTAIRSHSWSRRRLGIKISDVCSLHRATRVRSVSISTRAVRAMHLWPRGAPGDGGERLARDTLIKTIGPYVHAALGASFA